MVEISDTTCPMPSAVRARAWTLDRVRLVASTAPAAASEVCETWTPISLAVAASSSVAAATASTLCAVVSAARVTARDCWSVRSALPAIAAAARSIPAAALARCPTRPPMLPSNWLAKPTISARLRVAASVPVRSRSRRRVSASRIVPAKTAMLVQIARSRRGRP